MRHYEKLTKEDLAMACWSWSAVGLPTAVCQLRPDDLSADPWTFIVKVIGTRGNRPVTPTEDWVEDQAGHLALARLPQRTRRR